MASVFHNHILFLIQCSIDLLHNELIIGTTGTKTKFLDEGDLPDHAKMHSVSGTPSEIESEDQQLAKALERSAQEAAGIVVKIFTLFILMEYAIHRSR